MKAIIAFLLMVSTSHAGHSICLRTSECNGRSCIHDYGTGVVLSQGETGIWSASTAAHVVQNASRVEVFLDGKWNPVRSVYRLKTDDDAAFVTFDYAGKLTTTPTISDDEEVPVGEAVTFSGYSGGSAFERSEGWVTDTGTARVETAPKGGQSGGGVYRKSDGALIGILIGHNTEDPHEMVYTPCGRCRRQCHRQWGMWWGVCVGPPASSTKPAPLIADVPPPHEANPPAKIAGQPGPPGAQGPMGPPGRDGNSADVTTLQAKIDALLSDISVLKSEIDRLNHTHIPVQIVDSNGNIIDSDFVRLDKRVPYKDTSLHESATMTIRLPADVFLKKGANAGTAAK